MEELPSYPERRNRIAQKHGRLNTLYESSEQNYNYCFGPVKIGPV